MQFIIPFIIYVPLIPTFCSITAQTQQKVHIPAPRMCTLAPCQLRTPVHALFSGKPCTGMAAQGTFPHPGTGNRGAEVWRSKSKHCSLRAVRLLLVGQEFGSKGCLSNRRLLAEWQWLGSNRHFSAEKITARCGAKCQSFLYL